ncbi:unnamed protein product, partial [Prorocentrum cordatum]
MDAAAPMDADEAPVLLSKSSFAGAATLKGALKEGVQLLDRLAEPVQRHPLLLRLALRPAAADRA